MSSTLASRVRRPGSDAEPPPVESPGRARRLWSVLPVCAGFAVFGAIVWLAYQDASLGPPIGEPPLIRAAAEPIKLPPEQVQESTLAAEQGAIGRLWSDTEQADQPERLLPPPEEPLSPLVIEQPPTAEQTLDEPAGQPASEPAADTATMEAAREDSSDASVAAPSTEAPADVPDSASLQPATDESLQEAEAALDRLLAEVTALSGDTDAPGATAAGPTADEGAIEVPPDREESLPSEPATTAAAPTSDRAAPAVPPERPASEAPAAPARTSTEVRPAGAVTGAPDSDAEVPERATETAALSGAGAPISPPPVVPDGAFRIQLAAVRGEADARRAWDLFMVDLGPVLSEVEPIFERAETANGMFYRVQIGPFASQEAAESLCEELKQRNASCFVIRR